MRSHTLPLNGRVSRLDLTSEEAMELHHKGFRFSVFRPGVEICRLSLPIETIIDHQAATVTVRQRESAR